MNEAEQIERACADAWLAVGDPGTTTGDALRSVCDFAHVHGIDPVVQAIQGGPAERELPWHGWRPYDEYPNGNRGLRSARQGHRRRRRPRARARRAHAGWWRLTADTTEPTEAQRHVLTGGPLVGYGVAEVDGHTAGAVRGAVAGDMLLVARLAVDPAFRRRGLATALMAGIGGWAAVVVAATRCALQVSVGNTGALTLHEGLGSREHHRYRYWVPWKDRAS